MLYLRVVLIWISALTVFMTILIPILMIPVLNGAYSRTGDWLEAIALLTSHWHYIGILLCVGIYFGLPLGIGRANRVVIGVPKYGRRNFYSGAVIGAVYIALMAFILYLFDDGSIGRIFAVGISLLSGAISVMCMFGAYSEYYELPNDVSILSDEWRRWRLLIRTAILLLVMGLVLLALFWIYTILT